MSLERDLKKEKDETAQKGSRISSKNISIKFMLIAY